MTRVLRKPIVAFAFVVDRLRRLPGAGFVWDRVFWIVGGLLALAAISLVVWAAQRSPQRVTMADLTRGNVSSLQSWIIVSGDVRLDSQNASGYRYILTDPGVADASLVIQSRNQLPVGLTTVSGTLLGGNAPQHPGFAWAGQLIADDLLAREPDPPWLSIGLAALALFLAAAVKTTYPMFFKETTAAEPVFSGTISVRARTEWPPESEEIDAALTLHEGAPPEVRLAGEAPRPMRLHSAHSSADPGLLETLGSSEPALIVRPPSGELMFRFASERDRDAVYAALVADVLASSGRTATAG